MTCPTFTERIRTRQRAWWRNSLLSPATSVHRILDRVVLRSRTMPIARWRCCDVWQRSLLNKWNSREFASMLGVRVPELYWWGRDAARMPIDEFPASFVIKPAWGSRSRGVHVISHGTDLNAQVAYQSRTELKAMVLRTRGRVGVHPLLVEEFLAHPDGSGRSGLEYKFHIFGGEVGTIMTYRQEPGIRWIRHYTPDWRPIDDVFQPTGSLDAPWPEPPSLREMTRIATMLGRELGTFMRVDLYDTPSGVHFGEFSSVPGGPKGFTRFADDYLGRLWQEHVPDRV